VRKGSLLRPLATETQTHQPTYPRTPTAQPPVCVIITLSNSKFLIFLASECTWLIPFHKVLDLLRFAPSEQVHSNSSETDPESATQSSPGVRIR